MAIKKTENGKWRVDIQPGGRKGKRIQRTFQTKAEALRFETHTKNKALHNEDWNPVNDPTRLKELIKLWYESHGKALKDGFRRKVALEAICDAMGNPPGQKLTADGYVKYRSWRLGEGIKPKTCNNELTYIKALYNELKNLQIIKFENPLASIKPLKVDETELAYLSHDQIKELLETIKHHDANLITRICLATGARWGEAQGLKRRQVRDGHIHYTKTKSSKNRNIPISPELEKEILGIQKEELFGWSLSAFERALRKTSITLPRGQASHVLRHTFASHFMINGGNILSLQRALGHSDLKMTMRYAHLAPDHMSEVLELNPLSKR